MPSLPNVGSLFNPEPRRWGLRGDPYLWRALEGKFTKTTMPTTFADFATLLEAAFKAETGRKLKLGPSFHLEKFAHGGMSSGGIDPQFWIGKAIPLLIQRFARHLSQHEVEGCTPSEKDLDQELEREFRENSHFVRWFLEQCGVRDDSAVYAWSRSDHPWTSVQLKVTNKTTGALESIRREGETDVLVVIALSTGVRLALHIENKRSPGKFTKFQPEMYAARALKWKGDPKYGSYDVAKTVLIAPRGFLQRFPSEAGRFDAMITHESLSAHLPSFASSETLGLSAAG